MARIHPSIPFQGPLGAGDYRERDVLRMLGDGLPDNFDVFHNLPWSSVHEGKQIFGELDLVVISPMGHVVLIEVKAGAVHEEAHRLSKSYGNLGRSKDIGHQVRRQHSALMDRMQKGDFPSVSIQTLLVLPDHTVHSAVLAYPRERIVDAPEFDGLCRRILGLLPATEPSSDARQKVVDFFASRFYVVTDVSTNIGQVQQASTSLASGLATWVPKISHTSNLFFIQATAGSGKTQLALKLLQKAISDKHRCAYICFNRPLADHLSKLAPPSAEVTTFHQLCREHAERNREILDFAAPDVFNHITKSYIDNAEQLSRNLDLLIIDESQDFVPEWAIAVMNRLKEDGTIYVMGDAGQQIYEREQFDLTDAVHVKCMDNFRSPRKVVHVINQLQLSEEPIVSRSAHEGETPQIYTWTPNFVSSLTALNQCLKRLWEDGYSPDQVAVISFKGVKNSEALAQSLLGGYKTKMFSRYDDAGNALWTDGALLVESVYRFKGQSMPVVVLCEVDFDELNDREKRKLFVGLTRAQVRVDVVISEKSAQLLMQ